MLLTILLTIFDSLNNYVVMGGTVITSLIAYKWVIPYFQELYREYKKEKADTEKHKISIGKEIYETKKEANLTYQQQIDFHLAYNEKLQNTINGLLEELDRLRDLTAELKTEVMENKITILNLQNSCCMVADCPDRVRCGINNIIQSTNSN